MTKPATAGSASCRRITARISSVISSCSAFSASGRRSVMTSDIVDVVDQHVALGRQVGRRARGAAAGMPGRSRTKRSSTRAHSARAERAHQLQRPRLKPERRAAAEVEVGGVADAAIEDVDRLRQQHAEQAVADPRALRSRRPRSRGPARTVFQRSTERNIAAGR